MEKVYQIDTINPLLGKAVVDYLEQNGFKESSGSSSEYLDGYIKSYPWICIYPFDKKFGFNSLYRTDRGPKLSFEELFSGKYIGLETRVKLNDELIAIVEKDGVHVKCQIISFEAIEKLVNVIKKVKNLDK